MKYTDEQVEEIIAARDEAEAWLDDCLSSMREVSEFIDESNRDAAIALRRMNHLSSYSRKRSESLALRDARIRAEATRHARSLAESEAQSETGEWQSAMHAFADLLDEVAHMQECGDNGDCEEDS